MLKPTSWDKLKTEKMSDKISRQMLNGEHTTVARVWLGKGAVVPRHAHVSEQFSLILSGALKFQFDDGEVVVGGGEMIFIPSKDAATI